MGFTPIPKDQVNVTLRAMQEVQADEALEQNAEQRSSKEGFVDSLKEAVNPQAAALKQRKVETPPSDKVRKMQQMGGLGLFLPIDELGKAADSFRERHQELSTELLILLCEEIKPDDTPEEILKKVLKYYSDVSLADEALEFLITVALTPLKEKLQAVRQAFNEDRGSEIAAGRNIENEVQDAAKSGLGTTNSLRDWYRDVTHNPRTANTLFDELYQKYTYKQLGTVIHFLFHSLGTDLNSKGPSIDRAELSRLCEETRTLQAILGVYRHFRLRINLTKTLYENKGIPFPPGLNFERLAKEFMSLAASTNPNFSLVMDVGKRLVEDENLDAKVILLERMRDAVPEVSGKVFHTEKPKSDELRSKLFTTIIQVLTELYEQQQLAEDDAGGGI